MNYYYHNYNCCCCSISATNQSISIFILLSTEQWQHCTSTSWAGKQGSKNGTNSWPRYL